MERQDISGHLSGSEVLPRLDDAFDPTVSQRQVMTMHKYTPESIIDIYPCTPLQEDLMFLSLARPGTYIDRYLIYLHEGLSAERWIHSWQKVVAETPILRTKIIQRNEKEPLLQVVTSKVPDVPLVDQLDFYLSADQETPMGFGQPLHRIVRISNSKSSRACFVWTLHHAIYDGWSMDIILRGIQQTFTVGTVLQPAESFRHFIEYTAALDAVQSQNYWSNYLADTEPAFFPAPSAGLDGDVTRRSVSRNINMNKYGEFTLATYVKASWGILLASYNHTEDIVFACTVSGRDCPLVKIENIVGPTINVVPIRLDTRGSKKISELLYNVQRDAASSIPHQTLGLRNIQKLSSELRHVCDFNSLLIIQPKTITDFQDRKDIMELQPLNESSESVQYSLLLEVCQTADGLTVHLGFSTEVISKTQAYRIIGQFEHILAQLTIDQNQTLSSVGLLSSKDCANLVLYSKFRANLDESCIHLEINDQVNARPEALAVHSWDGDFSYKELSQASCQMAKVLLRNGLQAEQVVLLCFEKSKWTIVAALGVLMAGGTFCLLDIRDPSQRHHVIANITKAKIALTSPGFAGRLQGIVETILSVDARNLSKYDTNLPERPLPDVKAQQAAYIMFTSGSTGTPKGVAIEHRNFCYNSEQQRRVWNITNDTRFLQFASYSFTVSLIEIFTTLIGGGCVCVPSESERMEDLPSAVARLRATHACFTSSVLRTINPIEFPSLEFVMTSGEVVLQDDIRRWCDFVRLYQGYGQAECSPIVASTEMLTRESLPNCIGKPIGGRCWIVLPQDQNRLAPLGAIGELVVEGLHVGREYVNNPGKTREVFINHRRWTGEDIANKQGGWPMYRTGDLVRYGADGLLYYHGRKDFQVKVNGQRIELGEIESHLLQILDSSLDCAVDSIFVDSDGQRSMKLAAFVSIRDSRRNNGNPTDVGQNQREIIDRACQSASRDLKKLLSSYMIPSYYFALQYLPKTGSKKLDRKELRKMGGILAREFQKDRASSGILSIPESRLRKVWSRVLHIKEELIHSEDGFLQLGGDSLDAMRLSSEVRRNLQQQLSINSILKNCTLSAMAESMEPLEHEVIGSTPVLPFSLLSGDVGSIRNAASRACDVPLSAIEDIYPCTPMQQGLMALSSKHTGSYINQELFRLEKHVATTRMISSLKDVINAWPILRTRIVNIPHVGLVQVVIKEEITIPLSRNKKELVESYTDSTPSLGDRLSQFAICEGNSPGESFVLWRAHHAIYDAWSVNLLLQDIATCYETGQILLDRPSFATFVDHISREEVNTNAAQFWRSMLGDAQPTVFPFVIEPGYQARPDATVEYRFDVNLSDVGFTMSTILNAAWAILVEQYCGEEEAVIGITLSGRTQPCPSIEEIPGPTVVTIPLRVQTTNKNIRELLLEVQDQIVSAMPYQQYGLQKVMQLSESIHACCQFQTLFIVQAKAKPHGKGILSPYSSSEFTGGFTTHALLISCQLTESDSVELTATYDSNIITSTQISRLLEQFSHLARGLAVAAHCKEPSPYKDLRLISQHDTTQLKEWNQSPPPPVEDTIPSLIHQQSLLSPTSQAIDAWDGQMLYEDLDRLSDRLADHLVSALGVQTEDTIPLCFTKSMWVVVAMLGVLKSGARFTLLEVRNPSSRLDYLCRIVDAKLALAGEGLEDLVSGSVENVLTLNRSTVSRMEGQDQRSSRTVSPSNSAYVIFTSGSTGEPKGAIIEHRAFCSSAISQQKAFEINENTRFLQFASYSFGISLVDTLVTLISGGCICIPEQDELSQSLAGAIRRFNANTVFLTSTVMNLLEKDAVPSLHTLLSAGEPWNAHQIQYWGDHLRFVGGYGQSETAVISTSTSALTASESPSAQNIGRPIVGTAWITDRRNIDRLVPIGAVGELLLEGPQLGRGYLKNDSKTQEAFVSGLPWATQVGLRPDTRFYRTGDLARFAPDGCLEYIGRKDSQVKLHGQRVELGEVEHHLRKLSSYRSAEVAVEIITSDLNGRSNTVLGAFVSMKSLGLALDMNGCSKDPKALLSNNICVGALQEFSTAATELLYSELPGYMVPTVFLPIYELPLTVSGKLNRKKLREKGTELLQIQRQQEKAPAITEEPYSSLTEAEQTLRTLWGDVLQMRPETISADDHFLRLGGDSIAAMRLSSLALEHGISLLVSDVFSKPVLREMASVAKRVGKEPIEKISPFAILPDGSIVGSLLSEAFSKYGIKPTDVQDMYPCSPLQEGIMSLSTKLSGSYIIKISLDLRPNVDLPKFLKALHIVRRNHAILRTRICVLESSGKETMLQLVLSENDSFTVLERELERDEVASKAPSMSFGTPLSQFVLKKSTGCNLHRLDWFLHHTIYDAWSLRILLRSLRKAYHGLSESVITFNNFIRYIEDAERQEQDNDFWRKTLMGAERTPFPPVTTTNLETKASSSIEMTIELGKLTSSDVTISSILYLSWATVVGRYCDAEDVVLGVVLSGRSLPIPGIESISGPTFTTLPLRVNVSQEKQPSKLLIDVQDMSNKMIGHQHCGLHHIQALGEDIRNACTFNSLIFTEPPDPQESDSTESIFEQEFFVDSFVHPHPLLLSCKILRSGNILVTASYADSVLNETQTRRILAQFSHVCKQFFQVANGDNGISEISIASPEDYSEIVQWNSVRNAEARSCIHTLICNWADKHPYNRAIEAPDGTLSYEELNRYSDRLAQHLVSLDVQFEDVILICFEKTVWVPVAILATLKVGATFVMVGPCDSLVHRSFMASKTKAKMGITSKRCVGMLSMVDTVIVLHESTFTDLPEDGLFGRIVDPSSAAYIVFTSGSTGEPKGCVVEHANVSSSLKAFIKCSGLGPGTRGFQFAPHSSGTFLVETLGVLIAGGCLCIPSETDLGSNVEDTMNQLQVTWAIFIPSMLMGINPNRIKTLQGLAAIGEPLPKEVVISWNELVDLRSVYGQSETAEVMACSAPLHLGMNWRSIGRLKVGCGWIVEPHNHNQLAPVGCVGELIVEGPHIGRGYLDEQSIATNDFIYDPSWSKNIPRRDSNHYISRRFYKTSDLVRYDAEGNLEFVSRKGDRFMLNGQHIDLNEVQYRLREAVNEPITISVKLCELEPGKHRSTALIAFLSTNQAMSRNEELRITELLTGIEGKLAEDLPRIMIPSRYLLLEQLPKTPSGKLNYRQLEQIAAERRDTAVTNDWLQREITGELGIKLRAIWSTVLNVPEARIFEDTAFQSLGGDSISAIQVVSKCRAEGISISVNLLLQHKSISKLSKMVQDQDHGYYEEDSEEDDDLDLPFPLLPIQQFHFETVPLGENCFNLSHLLEVRVGVSENALREALDVLVQRHPALTTRFIQAGARWFQVISSEKNNPYLFHYREVAAMGDVTEICKLLQTQLDIRNGPLFAAGYFVIKSRQFLFLTIHHLVVDFVSLRILLGELESSLSGGVASSLRSLSVQKWSALLRAKTESDQEVKKEILSAFPKTNLKFWNMQHRPKLRGDMSVHTFELAEHVSSAILSQCEPLEAEPVELFLAATTFAFKNIFFEREGPNVYLEGHGREVWSPRIDITSTVGWFAAFMPVNSPPGRRVSFLEELDCVRSTHRKREDHGTLDFASLFSLEGRYEERSSYQNMEIAFIYAGLNQHLERENSLFKEVEGCEEIGLAGFAGKLPWFSLMDVIVSITDGKIRFDIFWNKHMNHQTRLEQWAAETASVLRRIPEASIYSGPTAAVAEFQ